MTKKLEEEAIKHLALVEYEPWTQICLNVKEKFNRSILFEMEIFLLRTMVTGKILMKKIVFNEREAKLCSDLRSLKEPWKSIGIWDNVNDATYTLSTEDLQTHFLRGWLETLLYFQQNTYTQSL